MRISDSLRGRRNFLFVCQVNNARFRRLPVGKNLKKFQHNKSTTSISDAVETFGTEFLKFYRKEKFQKTQKLFTNFQVLWLQAVITPQWLQIAGNSLQNWPSMGCLVSIFTVSDRINSKSFPWAVHSTQERYLSTFSATSDVRYCVSKPIVRRSAGAAWRPIYGRKADRVGNWK